MITCYIELITPEVAKLYLEKNTQNRSISDKQVDFIKRQIQSGHWNVTNDCIAFSESGTLVNGQHRLKAIIISDTPVECAVMRGLSEQSILYMDIGRKRKTSDMLAITKKDQRIRSTRMVATITSIVLQVEKNGCNTSITPDEIGDFVDKHPFESDIIYQLSNMKGSGSNPYLTANVIAALYFALRNGVQLDAIMAFARCYTQNVISQKYGCKAALDLRSKIRGKNFGRHEVSKYADKAIYLFVNNKTRAKEIDGRYYECKY